METLALGRRKAVALSLSGVAGLGFATRASATPDLSRVTLRVATYKGWDETFLPLAGLSNTPYQIEYHEFSSGQLGVEAMNAGAIDFGSWSEIPLAFATASKARIRNIATMKGDVNDQAVLVPKNSKVKRIADLKGKRVGYVRATTSHYFLLRMLWQAGLTFDDIQAINLSVTDGAVAFRGGDLDAWAIYGYAIQFALADGSARVLRTAQGILSGNYLIGVAPVVLGDPPLRAAAADYLVRIGKGWKWVESHKAQWSKDVSPVIHIPLPYVENQFFHESQPYQVVPINDAAIASAQLVADTFTKVGLISGSVDVKPYFDTSFSAAIAKI